MFAALLCASSSRISTHAPAGGATALSDLVDAVREISTHAPAGGATSQRRSRGIRRAGFLLTPLREGRLFRVYRCPYCGNFYSRPCGRGDNIITLSMQTGQSFLLTPLREGRRGKGALIASFSQFLLTPLREGRLLPGGRIPGVDHISTHAPAGGATFEQLDNRDTFQLISTHAPAGGATPYSMRLHVIEAHFYSRPCGRGDPVLMGRSIRNILFLLTPLREGRRLHIIARGFLVHISTHAPAGGATAIFHKSVMRFCGKLPKDDTVLCLASFGFPRRDPKAVYLAWISCANLPQKCVRQGLALKDQGTSCFHEGLASHAFDPVLV